MKYTYMYLNSCQCLRRLTRQQIIHQTYLQNFWIWFFFTINNYLVRKKSKYFNFNILPFSYIFIPRSLIKGDLYSACKNGPDHTALLTTLIIRYKLGVFSAIFIGQVFLSTHGYSFTSVVHRPLEILLIDHSEANKKQKTFLELMCIQCIQCVCIRNSSTF